MGLGWLFADSRPRRGVDRFKNINDSCGHHAGDDALKRVSALLRAPLRRTGRAGALQQGRVHD